jgi:hypothetical protein
MKKTVFFLLTGLLLASCGSDVYIMEFEVHAGNYVLADAPVYADLDSRFFSEGTLICLDSDYGSVSGQIENTDDSGQRIWWIVNLEPGETATYRLRYSDECYMGEFEWEQIHEHSNRLFFGNQPIIQYEHPVFDEDNIEGTKKPFHHVFEPAGDRLITKGEGGLYSHHRGIFFGYNRIYINDDPIDIWHSANGERSEHAGVIREFAGPVTAGHEVMIHWKDRNGRIFIEETREVRVFTQPFGETLIDFHSTLMPAGNLRIRLEGDRQHAGVQFRAAQYVADNREDVRFIRPEAWQALDPVDEIEGEEMYDMPWNAMHFRIGERLFTVSYMSHPSNPPFAEMSERLYGRFGEYFPFLLTEDNPLVVHYRFWIAEGEAPSIDDIDFRYRVFATPALVVETD